MTDKKVKGYWSTNNDTVALLIPKQRGEGYLLQPIGHHGNKLGKFIDDELLFKGRPIVTYVGLDGYLSLEIPYTWFDELHVIEKDIIKPIAEFTGFEYEYIEGISSFIELVMKVHNFK